MVSREVYAPADGQPEEHKEQVDVYKQAVEEYDFDELQEMRSQLKDQGEIYWRLWIAFVEKRMRDAQARIFDKRRLAQRIRYLLETVIKDHPAAIRELLPHIKSEDNPKGLIPEDMTKFVKNNKVDIAKLKEILGNVEASWQKRLTHEQNREKRSDWRGKLGKRISWPMSEMDQNLMSLTSEQEV